jgi:hypothetical protein
VTPAGDRDAPTVDASGAMVERIDGVAVERLSPHRDHCGSLTEVVNTRPCDHADPDKYRIDPHSGEIPFDWTLRDG